MTDKVIINDINVVSGCPNKSDDDCMAMPILNEYGDLLYYQSCQAQVACSYRLKQQLQCKEQELKQLKQKYYTSTTEVKEDLIKQNNSLKQECLELKDKLKSYECQKEFPNQCRCAFRCLDNEFCNDAEKKIYRYKQALEKIEDLATSGYLKDSRFCEAKELQQILKIINEVKYER